MEIEWARVIDGKADLDKLIDALIAAAAPAGVTNFDWAMRRASYRTGELTHRYDSGDERDTARAMYADDVATAYLSIVVFHAESRETTAHVQLDYDGSQTRVRVESGSARLIERFLESFDARA